MMLPFFLWLVGVLGFSELSFSVEPSDVTAAPNRHAVLDCQAQGEPPVDVRWLKNSVRVSEGERVHFLSNGSLHISNVRAGTGDLSDEGSYQCLAQNKYGAILSQRAHLTIAGISSFVNEPTPLEVTEGSVARFICKVLSNPPAIITWELNQSGLPVEPERITVLPNGVLQISEVKAEDAGSYRCVATNIASRLKSKEAALTVNPAPGPRAPLKPQIVVGPQNVSVPQHRSAVLECVATGTPRPLVSWSRADSKPIDVFNAKVLGGGNLVISDVKPQHSGVYLCRATIPRTRNYTITAANLTVLVPPSMVEKPESQTRPRAGTARFTCQAEGVPVPRITWLKNGEEVQSNGRIKMYNSKLVITQIMPEDDAIYQCMAENSQGSVLSTARLIVVMSEDRPSAPRSVHAETISSSAILLAWERPQYNAEKVIAYSVHYMKAEGLNNEEYQVVIGNDTTSYIVDDLEPARNYTFYIVAYMPMGASRMSEQITQHTLEDVPLRTPELSLTSHSPSDIMVSWQPLSAKLSRGRISAYRLSFRTATDSDVTSLELPGDNGTRHLLQDLQPDTIYLLRITASTRVGWSQPSAWSSHRTPRASSSTVPLAPVLQLEALNCTSIIVRWHPSPGNAVVQGYRLSYQEEGQPEGSTIQLQPQDSEFMVKRLAPRMKYHVKLLAFGLHGDGYQADQTVSTPGCPSTPTRRVATLPPPDHLHAQANSSSAVSLQWRRPAFTLGKPINYTVRYSPVGHPNASNVLYFHTTNQSVLVHGLSPSTRYEFVVRLYMDQMSSPWTPAVYQRTLPEVVSQPPSGIKVTLIEENTALVSWRPPDQPSVTVTHYTILYASQRAWVAGEWQILQRDGSNTMALLENLELGNVYLVKISASNQMGDGPFSRKNPRHTDGLLQTTDLSNGLYHLDQKSMTGIVAGVCIALACIVICVLILFSKSKARYVYGRKSSPAKAMGRDPVQGLHAATSSASNQQSENAEVLVPMMGDPFIDTKGGTNLMINAAGPVVTSKSRTWDIFANCKKDQRKSLFHGAGRTVLRYEEELNVCALQPSSLERVYGPLGDAEGSQNSNGSRETSDSGNYSHDESETVAHHSPLSLKPKDNGSSAECYISQVLAGKEADLALKAKS
uniref:Protogenin n=1 Tax=Denticeps clupeoides TaxID=299321 RepID=A0AAY4ER63_9TELE